MGKCSTAMITSILRPPAIQQEALPWAGSRMANGWRLLPPKAPLLSAPTPQYRVVFPAAGGQVSADLNGGSIPPGTTQVRHRRLEINAAHPCHAGTHNLGTFCEQRAGLIPDPSTGAVAAPLPTGWTLVWADEFNGTALDGLEMEHRSQRNAAATTSCSTTRPAGPENIRVTRRTAISDGSLMGKQYTSGSPRSRRQLAAWRISAHENPDWQRNLACVLMLGTPSARSAGSPGRKSTSWSIVTLRTPAYGTIHTGPPEQCLRNRRGGPSGAPLRSITLAVEWTLPSIRRMAFQVPPEVNIAMASTVLPSSSVRLAHPGSTWLSAAPPRPADV